MPDIDKMEETIIDSLKDIDWAKVVNYGSVKVQIRGGQVTRVTFEKTVMLVEK